NRSSCKGFYVKMEEIESGGRYVREQPQNKIAKDAVKAWRIHAGIFMIVLWLVIVTGFILTIIYDMSYLFSIISIAVGLVFVFLVIYIIPARRYRCWRYEIFEQDSYRQHGIVIRTRTLIPMIRVQHVDTEQGPILKRFKLATITISTAAAVHN